VLDTSILVSANGASNPLLNLAVSGRIEMRVSTPLLLEYEAVLTRARHLRVSNYSVGDIEELLDAICQSASKVSIQWQLRPQLMDADDEMVHETAVNGLAQAIVTFNRADFAPAAKRFGVIVLSPRAALERVGP
jgi:putative PIN family toxin of toxin-antitoxin system